MILIKNGYIIENNQLVKKDVLIKDNLINQIDYQINQALYSLLQLEQNFH